MGWCKLLLLLWSLHIVGTHQLQSSQKQVLIQLKKQLEYPKELEIWDNHNIDFCYLSPSKQLNITCQDNVVTELKITGQKSSRNGSNDFDGFAVADLTLSHDFSVDSFVTTLARLANTLKVLSLVSLGIWGPLPDKIHRLSSLEYLDLSSNYLYGSVPTRISTMVNVQTLILDDNFFNGTFPSWFVSLSNLTTLSLRNNRLQGELPDLSSQSRLTSLDLKGNKLGSNLPLLPKGLLMVSLSNNSFSGGIPRQYNTLNQLQHLDLSFNRLTASLPSGIFLLPNISSLNLGSNMFSGSLPRNLKCGAKLDFVDISNNRIKGKLPPCLSDESGEKVINIGGNCFSANGLNQQRESYCTEAEMKKDQVGRRKDVGKIVGIVVGLVVIMIFLALGLLAVCRRYCLSYMSEQQLLHKPMPDNSTLGGFSSEISTNSRSISEAAKLGLQGLPACRSFTLEELKEATNNFDDSAYMGEGSYGRLYKGRLQNATQVAIRCLPSSRKYTIRNLKLRLDLLARLRHPHLVCLLGHCIDGGDRDDYNVNTVFLVYEFIPDGSFRSYLSDKIPGKILNWTERLEVIMDIAKAVRFLHTGVLPGFFNNQLRTHNILLNEHRVAKLSDYGLSIILEDISNGGKQEDPKSWQMTKLEGDAVFSFGFMILESILGPSVSDRKGAFLQDELASLNSQEGWKLIVSPTVLATSAEESLSIAISIANKCISSESWSRPSFDDILWYLQHAAQLQATKHNKQRV